MTDQIRRLRIAKGDRPSSNFHLQWSIGLLLLLVAWPKNCPAQSLWEHRSPDKVFLFYDVQARHVGDLLTIVIQEQTDVENQDSRELEKSSDTSATFDFSGSTGGDFGTSSANAELDTALNSDRQFDGSSRFSSDRQFSDRVTVTVLDVLPNGNLIVGGRRRVVVEGELRTLVVSGIVRPVDVRPDNSVLSRFVANLELAYEGAGVEPRFVNQGWLGRIGNKLWPF